MDNQDRNHEHLFIVILQIFQQFLGFLAECHKVRRQNVHIKTGADSPFLFVYLCLIQVAQLAFNRFQGSVLVKGFGMDTDNLASLHI